MAAKEKEVLALTKAIESKSERVGELGVEIVQMEGDLSDTEKALLDDKAFLADMEKNCALKKAEYDAHVKVRAKNSSRWLRPSKSSTMTIRLSFSRRRY